MIYRLQRQLSELATMSPAQLTAAWQAKTGVPAPKLPSDLLRLALAHRVQEKAMGGLAAAAVRELRRIASPANLDPAPRPTRSIGPGARLIREWHGRTIEVEAVEGGFLFDKTRYASLTAIAREVTGAHWSGPRFFGLTSSAQ